MTALLSPTRVCDKRFGVNTYIVNSLEHAFMIDPVLNPTLEKIIDGSTVIDFAILTHEHYDHICSVTALKAAYDFPILCSEDAKHGLTDPSVSMSRYVDFLKRYLPFGTGEAASCDYSCQADRFLKDGETLAWQGHSLLIKETPGHSKGSICILLDNRYLFSGDTIFKDYATATRLPGGSTKAFHAVTEPWLESLPQDIVVCPGHTEPFRLYERYSTDH